jgi:iron-regulated transporter 1
VHFVVYILLCHPSWDDRTAEFAFFLYLSELFVNTLLPSSLLGFFATGSAVLLSPLIGSLADKSSRKSHLGRLHFTYTSVVLQKLSGGLAAALFIPLFTIPALREAALLRGDLDHSGTEHRRILYTIFSFIVFLTCTLRLATTGVKISVQRESVLLLSTGSSDLTRELILLKHALFPLIISRIERRHESYRP